MDKFTIEKEYYSQFIIKRSEFITSLFPVNNLEDVNRILDQTKKKYYDATHNCYAYILDIDKQIYEKGNDDGEPSKTAGIIILDVLKKNNLVNVLCIVTRYFGGIKLGANGLVRAYSNSASDVIKNIDKLIKIEEKEKITLSINYDKVNEVLKLLSMYEEESKIFEKDVTLTYIIPSLEKETIIKNLIEITKNNISFK